MPAQTARHAARFLLFNCTVSTLPVAELTPEPSEPPQFPVLNAPVAVAATSFPGRVIFYGGDAIRRWSGLQESFQKYRFEVEAVCLESSTLAECAFELDRQVISRAPTALVYSVGVEDVAGGASVEQMLQLFQRLIGRTRSALGEIPIICLAEPTAHLDSTTGRKVAHVFAMQRRLVQLWRYVHWVDLFAPPGPNEILAENAPVTPRELGPEQYERWGVRVRDILNRHRGL